MQPPFTAEDADRLAAAHFVAHYQDCGGRFRPVRVAELPKHGKVYYQVRWALAREPTDDEDGGYIGDGGFFVSLTTGEIEQFGSGDVMGAWGIIRSRDGLAAGVESSPAALAEVLASYSREELRRHSMGPLIR